MTKRLATLILAAAMVLGTHSVSSAIDFKAKGAWNINFDGGSGGNFTERGRSVNGEEGSHTQGWGRYGEDSFEAKSRVRLQLEAVASENLSGTVYFEMGSITWGRASKGGALGTDGMIVKVKHSYLDWNIPQTDLKIRMGLQRVFLPDFATEASQVFDADVAGIVASLPFSDNVGLTAFWVRPYNDNWSGDSRDDANTFDNVDFFGLAAPLSFPGINITPWAMGGAFGSNSFRAGDDYYGKNATGSGALGLAPAVYALKNGQSGRHAAEDYATVLWGGITTELTAFDPFRLAASFNYGAVETGEEALNRRGWYVALLAEYKTGWGTPGIYGWYASGDDDDVKNGSERMPNVEANNESTNGMASFGALGTWTLGRDTLLGSTFAGTWGAGLRVRNISFLDKFSHTVHANILGGTNSPAMAKYIKGARDVDGHILYTPDTGEGVADFNSANYYGLYLTTQDYAAEFGITSTCQIYDNLRMIVEANYIALWLDQSRSVWGGYTNDGDTVGANSTSDAWNVNLSFVYRF